MPLHFLTIKTLLRRYSVNFYIFIWHPEFSIITFHSNNRLFKGNNAFLKLPHTHTPFCYTILIKNTFKNRHTSLRLKLEFFFFNLPQISSLVRLKKCCLNPKLNSNHHSCNTIFQPLFKLKEYYENKCLGSFCTFLSFNHIIKPFFFFFIW